jgi:hypothetical protein
MENACSAACPGSQVLAIDPGGNAYVMAAFRGTVDFGSTNITAADGVAGMFLAKFDPTGRARWVTQFEDAIGGVIGVGWEGRRALALDSTGNLYAAGVLTGPAVTQWNPVLIKFDVQGQVQWVWRALDPRSYCKAVAVDANDNVIVAGHVQSTLRFCLDPDGECPGPELHGDSDGFVAKFDANGQGVWFQAIEGLPETVDRWVDANGVATDASGNVYVTGQFAYGATFGASTGSFQTNLVSQGISDIFLAKYDSSGTLLWVVQQGSTLDGADADSAQDEAFDVAVDAAGHVYITGCFGWPGAVFGATTLATEASREFFLAKYDSDGTLLWAQDSNDASWKGTDLRLDAAGNAHVLSHSLDDPRVQLKKFDPAGRLLWAQPHEPGSSYPAYRVAPDGAIFAAGRFTDELVLGGSVLIAHTGVSGFYIARSDTVPSEPRLTIELAGENVALSWPAAAAGYQLFHNDSLNPMSWMPVTAPATTNELLKIVTLPHGQGPQFYQLITGH